jgi:16S rRNA (guanine527-N7)-methyltransferase
LVAHLITPTTYMLLLKGRKAQDELTDASERWTMSSDVHQSRTSPDGVIVRLANIRRAHVPNS